MRLVSVAVPAIPVLLALALPTRAQGWDRVDAWSALGEPCYGVVSAGLTTSPPDGLRSAPAGADGATRYAAPRVGDSPLCVAVVGEGEGLRLVVDTDRDGDLAEEDPATVATTQERPPGLGKETDTVWLARVGPEPETVVALRVGGFGRVLFCAARGYWTAPAGPEDAPVVLRDGNANGVLDGGLDELWLDRDGDGLLERDEGEVLLARGRTLLDPRTPVLLSVGLPLAEATWSHGPTGSCLLRPRLPDLAEGASWSSLRLMLTEEDGRSVAVEGLTRSTKVPYGYYALSSAVVEATAADGSTWQYTFGAVSEGWPLDLSRSPAPTIEPLAGLAVTISATGTLEPGGVALLRVACEGALAQLGLPRRTMGAEEPEEVAPSVAIVDADGKTIGSFAMGFG